MQAAIALYMACGYQEGSQEATVNDMPRTGGSLLGEAPDQPHLTEPFCIYCKATCLELYDPLIQLMHAGKELFMTMPM